jgi:hypothetical protein
MTSRGGSVSTNETISQLLYSTHQSDSAKPVSVTKQNSERERETERFKKSEQKDKSI